MAKDLGEIKITVQIAERTYPLTIQREEEEIVRKATKAIGEGISKFGRNVAAKDNQDLIALVALEFATKYYKSILSSREQLAVEVESQLDQLALVIKELEKTL